VFGDDCRWMAGAESNKVCSLNYNSHLNNYITRNANPNPNPNTKP